ncbi:MAG: FAD-dependent oxidoreductase [Candidatus Omnitrophica bacterium]|nr:FAD-dependent oxidoreductase [Candidatus Omnitrophota bacterium]
MYDVIIIGAGPAGLTAAIYASREKLETLILEKAMCGGLATTTEMIENYPGFPDGISGLELMGRFKAQAERFGARINETEAVESISGGDGKIKVKTGKTEHIGRSVIVASGNIPKELGVPGEKRLMGKGVSYCATCDGPLYRGKDVAIIGCGNSGLQEGESLLRYVKSVNFIEFLPYMTASKILQERLQRLDKTTFLLNTAVTSINGDAKVESITVRDRSSARVKDITVSGVFIYAGYLPNTDFLKGSLRLDERGYIVTDTHMRTSMAGVFAAGDVIYKSIRQVDTACGDGTIAALSALEYIKGLK